MAERIERDGTGAFTGLTLERELEGQRHLRRDDVDEVVEHQALAFVYEGHWVVDCSAETCLGAEALTCCGPCPFQTHNRVSWKVTHPWRQTAVVCSACGTVTHVVWPPDAEAINQVLAKRPGRTTRNWAPNGHRQSALSGFLRAQTVDDLRAENRDHNVED